MHIFPSKKRKKTKETHVFILSEQFENGSNVHLLPALPISHSNYRTVCTVSVLKKMFCTGRCTAN